MEGHDFRSPVDSVCTHHFYPDGLWRNKTGQIAGHGNVMPATKTALSDSSPIIFFNCGKAGLSRSGCVVPAKAQHEKRNKPAREKRGGSAESAVEQVAHLCTTRRCGSYSNKPRLYFATKLVSDTLYSRNHSARCVILVHIVLRFKLLHYCQNVAFFPSDSTPERATLIR